MTMLEERSMVRVTGQDPWAVGDSQASRRLSVGRDTTVVDLM